MLWSKLSDRVQGFTRKKRGGGGSVTQESISRPIGLTANQIVMNPAIEMSQFGSTHNSVNVRHVGNGATSGFEEDD